MMLCFAAAGLLVMTYQPSRSRSLQIDPRSPAPPPSETVSPLSPVLTSGDLPSRPGGWRPRAIARLVPAAPQATARPASPAAPTVASPQTSAAGVLSPEPSPTRPNPGPSASSPSSPTPAPTGAVAGANSAALAPAQATPDLPKPSAGSAPERAIAALATGILPTTQPRPTSEPRIQPRPANSPRLPSSDFVPVQSASQTLTTLPLHTPRLVVDLSDRLVYFYHGDQLKASYSVAIGQDGWETPQGTFRVIDRQTYPLWEHPAKNVGSVLI